MREYPINEHVHYVCVCEYRPFYNKGVGCREGIDFEKGWKLIFKEARHALSLNLFKIDKESLHEKGWWSHFLLYSNGKRIKNHCSITPITCMLIKNAPKIVCFQKREHMPSKNGHQLMNSRKEILTF